MIQDDSGYIRRFNPVLVGIITIVLMLIFWQIRDILMLAFAGFILTSLAEIPVGFFTNRWNMNRALAILLSMSLGILFLILLIILIFPTLFAQFSVLFTETIPRGINQLIELWNSGELYERIPFLESFLATAVPEIDSDLISQALNQVATALSTVGGSVIPLLGGVASGVLSAVIIFFLCIYLIAEPSRYVSGIIALTPLWYRDRMRHILTRISMTVRAWLLVTGVSMVIVGTGTGLVLAFLGIEQWLALGVLSGVLSFIPNFGTLGAIIPSIAVAAIQAPDSVLLVILFILIISFIQAQIVGPILTNESMNLAPVLILLGQIVFGIFFGFLGLMLAVPLIAITVVLVEEIYVKDVLGDDSSEKPKNEEEEDDGIVFAEAD